MNVFLTAGTASFSFIRNSLRPAALAFIAAISIAWMLSAPQAQAQQYRFTQVEVEGNLRIETATILTYAGIARGETVSAAVLNDAYQRIIASGLFETVEVEPRGNTLFISVVEFPTISQVNIEGNRRLDDDALMPLLQSAPRRVFSPTVAEADAALIVEAYAQAGRFAASVDPVIIRRSDNRVDLVFEVSEGRVTEIDRISFVGNRAFSDRRLRRVIETKQAGLLRTIIRSDTFIADRIEFDRQVLYDFYVSRGYIDFEVLSVTNELSRERDAFFTTFNVREGQSFNFGEITVTSDVAEADPDLFEEVIRIRPGQTYSPMAVEVTIARLERLALRFELNFIRIEPRVTRNDRDLTLDIEFVLIRGPRIFVERIDIEGNSTTLDRVVREQFRVVEGDPFNPREIRESAERIRALGFFSQADVNAREGTGADQVVIDVDVEETPTGSLSFGASFSQDDGVAFAIGFSERNFLGRGQGISFDINTASDTASASFRFTEPSLLGRDLELGLSAGYRTSDNSNADYSTRVISFSPSLEFPISENGRLQLHYRVSEDTISDVSTDSSTILQAEEGGLITSAAGFTYNYDTRRTGLDPNTGVVFRFTQDIAGLGGDNQYSYTSALLGAETSIWNEEVTVRATLEGGAVHFFSGGSRVIDRFRHNSRRMRGFEANGMGPRDTAATNDDALGGNFFVAARFEADFPLGLPEEYGITGGLFFDVGSIWGLDDNGGGAVDDSFNLRSVIGFSVFWDTALGPLRFNFSHPLQSESYDETRSFDLTISTSF